MSTFKERRSLVERCTEPRALSLFYRNHYNLLPVQGPLTIASEEAWQALPFVTKQDLVRHPLRERTFIPLHKTDSLYVSSGTSGNPSLFMLRNRLPGWEGRGQYPEFKGSLLSSMGFPHRMEYLLKRLGKSGSLIALDQTNPRASARLATQAGVCSLFLHAHLMPTVGTLLAEMGAADNITLIDLGGGICSQSLFSFMQQTFPNAVIIANYGATEIDSPMATACHPLADKAPFEEYHALENFFLEIIDPATGRVLEPKKGVEGELVVTAHTAEACAFPLIRYRIGDMVHVVQERCARHGRWSFTILGRADFDFLKIPGGMLRADEVARVLRTMKERVEDEFTLEVAEESIGGMLTIRIILCVKTKQTLDFSALAEDIARALRVGPSLTYAQAMERGLYGPLTCKELPDSHELKKRKRVIRHTLLRHD